MNEKFVYQVGNNKKAYWKYRALWVIHKERREVNGMHVYKNGNLMRQEASE